ncbi:MAG: hypothetical protein IJO85_07890 [Lachnospiraceae bacterium]|nr:hypothetical protein [Lachnospiraceae bacterium]
MNKKRFTINMVANIITFVINLSINFILSPFIVENLGVEANGFVTLSNTIVSYANVFTVALNSMFGRYISVEIHRGNQEKAKKYFSTVFYANCISAFAFSIIGIIFSVNVDSFLEVPVELLVDVKLTFALTFANYIVGLLTTVFNVSTFVRNRLDLSSLSNIVQYFVRALGLLVLFVLFPAHIFFVPLAGLLMTIVGRTMYASFAKKLTPELKIDRKLFTPSLAINIVKEGAWFSLQQFNKILETGLDLLISNQMINGVAMGRLSIAKTVPNMIYQLTTTIANVFSPMYAESYAEKKKEQLIKQVKLSISCMSIILMPIMTGFIVFGQDFYRLWQPTLDEKAINQVQILSVLTVLPTLFNGYVEGLYYINTLTKKVKTSVLVSFGFSLAAIICEVVLLLTTDGGVYIIAGTSAVFMSIRYLVFTPFYCAYVLKIKWYTFMKKLYRAVAISIIELVVFLLMHRLMMIDSWISFFVSIAIAGFVGYIIAILLVPTKDERGKLIQIIKKKTTKG